MVKYKKYEKILLPVLVSLLLAFISAVPAGAQFNTLLKDVPKLTGASDVFLLLSLDDGSVIFSQNETLQTAPASLTKVATAILVLEKCRNLQEIVTAKESCISMFYGRDSSNAGIRTGEQLTVEQLLYCMMLPSANEAAAILADHAAGSVEAFVAQMNDLARRLGCKNTKFMNPHGLDEAGHYTTAEDMAKITRYAMSREFSGNAVFEKIAGMRTYEIPPTNKTPRKRSLVNTNKMLNKYYPDYYSADISGIKTGTTDQAGCCVIAKASHGGFSYLCVVMRGKIAVVDQDPYTKNTAFVDAKALLDWSFAHIRLRQVTETGKAVAELPVEMARDVDHVQLVPKESKYAFVPDGVDSGSVLIEVIPESVPKSLVAPVKEGQVIGRARILFAGSEFAQVDLMAAQTVNRSATMYLVSLAKEAVRSPVAKALLAAVILVAGIYLAVVVMQNRRKRREKQLRVLPDITAGRKS